MSLHLSTADLAHLEAATRILLAPLAYGCVSAWRAASRHEIQRLLGADSSGSLLPLEGEPLAECDPELRPGAVAYETYFHRLDTGVHVTRRERGLTVFSVHDIYDWAAYRKSEIYADWNRPHRLFDSVAMAVDLAPGPPAASLHFYHEREGGRRFGERGLVLLRLLQPAFAAGVGTLLHARAARAERLALLDRSGEALLLYDRAGRLYHATPAATALLGAEPEVERQRMRGAADALAATLTPRRSGPHREPAVPTPRVGVRTSHGVYRLAVSLLGTEALTEGGGATTWRHPLASEAAILVTITPAGAAEPLTDAALRARYGLTAREVAVTRLLAERRSAGEIATLLGISRHTGRRHTEHVFEKLGVHRRSEIAALLSPSRSPRATTGRPAAGTITG